MGGIKLCGWPKHTINENNFVLGYLDNYFVVCVFSSWEIE